MPPKSAVMTPKPLAQPAAFDPVDFMAARSCSRRGAWGTSRPNDHHHHQYHYLLYHTTM
jgi:hypothetical protein